MRRRFTPEEEEAQIDLTPMLDVVFIMLIFFIVTASFVKEFGIDVNRPEKSTEEPDKKAKNILISITNTGQIYFNRQPRVIDIGSVRANIERFIAANPEAAVVIQAEKGAKVGLYTKVHEAAQLAGVANIVMATE